MSTPPYPQQSSQPPYPQQSSQPQYPQQSGQLPHPGSPPAQPGYAPQPPYAQAPYDQAAAQGSTGPARNPLGLTAVILGAIPLLLGIVQPFLTLLSVNTSNYAVYGIQVAALNGLALLLGLAALIVGIIGLLRKGASMVLAGIGVGLGIAAVVGGATAFLYPLIVQLGY